MTLSQYEAMSLDELRHYILSHREDTLAFQIYVDRSKTAGRMITINPDDPDWEQNLDQKIQQSISNETESK
jgi:hypothetical protein